MSKWGPTEDGPGHLVISHGPGTSMRSSHYLKRKEDEVVASGH